MKAKCSILDRGLQEGEKFIMKKCQKCKCITTDDSALICPGCGEKFESYEANLQSDSNGSSQKYISYTKTSAGGSGIPVPDEIDVSVKHEMGTYSREKRMNLSNDDTKGEGVPASNKKFCTVCGTSNSSEAVFCMKCGNRMNSSVGSVPQAASAEDHINIGKGISGKKIAAISGAAALLIVVFGAAVHSANKSNENEFSTQTTAQTVTEVSKTTIAESEVTSPVTTTAASTNAVTYTTTVQTTESYTEPIISYDNEKYGYLDYVNSWDYSIYDVFTDVDAVADVIASYDGSIGKYEFLYNQCRYEWQFGEDFNGLGQYMFQLWLGHGFYLSIPIEELEPYLKTDIYSTLIYNSNASLTPLAGNSAGNYANFSGCTVALYGGLMYFGGGDDYKSWQLRCSSYDDPYNSTVICTDLSDMVMVDDESLYYRNSAEDCILYRINTDGTNRVRLTDSRASNVRLYKNMLYYSENGSFWKMNKDGSGKTLLANAFCYLPNFYDDYMYCISSDNLCIDIYNIDGSYPVDHLYLDTEREMYIENFFIQNNVIVARGYYTDNNQKTVVIANLDDYSQYVRYDVDAGGINADAYYIYICYQDDDSVCMAQIPLRDFLNEDAIWVWDMPGMLNSYFYIINYIGGSGIYFPYFYQNDLEGKIHQYSLN